MSYDNTANRAVDMESKNTDLNPQVLIDSQVAETGYMDNCGFAINY